MIQGEPPTKLFGNEDQSKKFFLGKPRTTKRRNGSPQKNLRESSGQPALVKVA
jgi:hypothetical protein